MPSLIFFFRRIRIVAIAAILASTKAVPAAVPIYAEPQTPIESFSWLDQIQANVPPLKNTRGTAWPMILWECGPFAVQLAATYTSLLARGLTQHIQLDGSMIPTAQALQNAGSPVVMMQGIGGTFPSDLAGDPTVWAHLLDPDFIASETVHACPAITKGWAVEASNIRATMQKYLDAGVTVDAVWMDWEGDPIFGAERYRQATHCSRCRATLPPEVLVSEEAFRQYCWRRYIELTGTYLAAPVMEIFPVCSTTNWRAMISSKERPLRSWINQIYPPTVPPMFSASNPVAYGNTVLFYRWKQTYTFDREHVDQFYMHHLLGEVSGDAKNRVAWAPGRRSIPWVARWVPDDPNPAIPIMTRPRYREMLRHLWLRGIRSMQVFNPRRPGYEHMAIAEVQDASTVYDEMLPFREFIDSGKPLSYTLPAVQSDAPFWSGLRLDNRAVVRTFKQGGGSSTITIDPWPGHPITLAAPAAGKTYRLSFNGTTVTIAP